MTGKHCLPVCRTIHICTCTTNNGSYSSSSTPINLRREFRAAACGGGYSVGHHLMCSRNTPLGQLELESWQMKVKAGHQWRSMR
mmetsp:Transcript_40469/g.69829  ORF Transcript_40469/g.69829 Transcript_40469/m.69829 type:complete len:84 (+) Transcript_40469:1735-1986(+)